jgi:endonuclease I
MEQLELTSDTKGHVCRSRGNLLRHQEQGLMEWLSKAPLEVHLSRLNLQRLSAQRQIVAAVWIIIALLGCRVARAAYEVPTVTAYNAPTNYYASATGTGLTLRGNLHTIISANFTMVSYGDSRWAMGSGGTDSSGTHPGGELDQDPSNLSNIKLVYTNTSVSGVWAQGVTGTWNREHVWPKNWLNLTSSQVGNSYKGPASDLFELRPADPDVNSARGDNAYGFYPNTTGNKGSYGTNTASDGSGTYWFPNIANAGEVARSIFYMATRYFTASNSSRGTDIQNLEIVAGQPGSDYHMGDLISLLHWNYEYGVDNFERRRNAYIYGKSFGSSTNDLNPNYFQGNRNPFIDHPEYVWAVYGTDKDGGGNVINNSQIYVGGSGPAGDGSSTATVDLGRVMVNGTFGTSNVALTKTGADPTTFDITTSGSATTVTGGATNLIAGTGQGIDYGTVNRTITVGLNASTSTNGLKSGSISIHNSDLTTSSAGHGSADGNDTINISGAVLSKRVVTPSTSNVAFGSVIVGATVGQSINLTTTGDDNSYTRVNVAGSSSADGNGVQITGSPALFNSASSTSSRNLGGTLTGAGSKSGSLSVAVNTAENGGTGLTGEGSYSSINIGYSATVLDHANASFSGSSDTNSLTIDFGRLGQNTGASGVHEVGFNLYNLEATAGFTAGLALNSISPSGSAGSLAAVSTDLAAFSNLAAGSHSIFDADVNTSSLGTFSVTYTLGVSDQTLPGAIANTSLTLTVMATVNAYAPGDFNLDQHVDAADIMPMLQTLTDPSGYESQYGVSPTILAEIGDVDDDGSMTNADLQALENELIADQGSSTSVPEPASLVLLGLGSLILLQGRRRQLRSR